MKLVFIKLFKLTWYVRQKIFMIEKYMIRKTNSDRMKIDNIDNW